MSANKSMSAVVAVVLVIAAVAFAAVPTTINYQGYLRNTDGTPVSIATSVRFSLYSSNPTRNNPIWREMQSVTPENGIYSTQLGSVTPITPTFDVPYWLGVKVAGDAEMALQALSSVPYARRAGVADTLSDSATLSGQAIADLDLRYKTPSAPNPTLQQIATRSWEQVRSGDLTSSVGNAPSALVFDGRNIWVANNTSNNVMKINPATGAILGTYGVGSGPFALAFDGTNIWVANYDSNNVMKLNPATGTVIGTCTVGTSPIALAFDGTNIWVANFNSHNIMKVNPDTSTVIGTYSGGTNPRALAFDGTYIWVASQTNNNVMKISLWGSTIGTYPVGTNPDALAFDGASIWVANLGGDNVTKLNPSSGSVIGTYAVGYNPYALFFDGTSIWVANRVSGSVMKLNRTTGAITGTYTVGNYPYSLAFDGASIWVANYNSNTIMKLANAGIQVGDLAVGTAQLADNSVTSAKISGTIAAAKLDLSSRVAKAGDTMAGTLNVPDNGLVVGTNQLVASSGNVGIGTATPAATLTVVNNSAATKGLTVQGAASQAANLQEWQDSGGTTVASVSPVGDLNLNGNLILPETNGSTGIIKLGAETLMHTFGTQNFFAGVNAGNFITTGSGNLAIGGSALSNNTTGNSNTADGQRALDHNTTGSNNTASGHAALDLNSTGSNNTASGSQALYLNTTGEYNTAVGFHAGVSGNPYYANDTGSKNTFIGAFSGSGVMTELQNATAIGYNSMVSQSNSLVLGGTGTDAVKVGIGTKTPAATLTLVNSAAATKGLTVQGAASQTANLQEWQNSSGTVLASVSSAGVLSLPANGLAVGGNQLVVSGGHVGVGKTPGSDFLDVAGTLRTNDNQIYLRAGSDTLHGVGWYVSNGFVSGSKDGPVVYGCGGGTLGSTCGGNRAALTWDNVGNVSIPGTLSKGGGSFKIDHPLDPRNKYLYHSFVESPDMMNIYNGNATTDVNGFAVVEMPEWFGTLNKDFRYQLTVIGKDSWARARVYEEFTGSRFIIQTDIPTTKVSWQVTGIRKDAYAEKNRIKVEEDKPAEEKGTCLHPEACR